MNLIKSRIFLYFCLAFILGVGLASFVKISAFLGGIFLIVALMFIILFWSKKWETVVLGFCLVFAVLGIWRYQAKAEKPGEDVSRLNENKVVLTVIIIDQPDRRMENQKITVKVVEVVGIDNGAQFLEVRPPYIESLKVNGNILITAPKYPEYQYGDELKIKGKLQEPKIYEDFDYQAYLAKDDIYSVMYLPETEILSRGKGNKIKAFLFAIKNKFEEKLFMIFPEPSASLADGLVLGVKSTLPQRLLDIFVLVGVTHIIALSGFNITIIAEALRRVFDYLMVHRLYSFWITVVFIISFVLMTGASASIVRAGVMGILIILARRAGRMYNIRNALVFAALCMLWFNPKILRFDLGFQLSFMATLGLVYLSPVMEKWCQWLPERFDLRGIGIATLSAQLAVLPLILFSFGKLSLIAPVANLLILPFVPLAMFLIFGVVGASFIWLKLGIIISWLAWLILTYVIKISELLARIPLSSMDVKISWLWMAGMYIALGGVILYISAAKIRNSKLKISPEL